MLPTWLLIVATGVAAYLIGGIPFGLIVGKLFWKEDVRKHGSGNIGATNVLRTLGPVAGGLTFALDILKGVAAVLLATVIVPAVPGQLNGGTAHELAGIVATVCVMLGHTYSPYLGFKGGKGVATAAGAIIALLTWKVWVPEIAIFIITIATTRMVSLGSILMALVLPGLVWLAYPGDWLMFGFSVLAAAIVIWRHRTNIGRILRGEENKVTFDRGSIKAGPQPPKGE